MSEIKSKAKKKSTSSNLNLLQRKVLGYYLDGWAEIVEDMGSKAKNVRKDVLDRLRSKKMPEVATIDFPAQDKLESKEKRDYITAETSPGVTTTIYIDSFGKDLYASWRTFIKPIPNWFLIRRFMWISLVLGLAYALIRYFGSFFRAIGRISNSPAWSTVIESGSITLLGVIVLFFTFLSISLREVNKKGSNFFIFLIIFILACVSIVFFGPTKGIGPEVSQIWQSFKSGHVSFGTSLVGGLRAAASVFIALLILTALWGLFYKRNPLWYFVVDPTLFDDEDITALSLVVHQTILRALDDADIDTSQLRIKQTFTGGRRGEDV